MIKGIKEEAAGRTQGVVEGKIRFGVSVLKVSKQGLENPKEEADVKGVKILYILHNKEWKEVIGESADKKAWFIKVNKDTAGAFPRSVPWFVLPPVLEGIYGKRATQIKIMFASNELEEVIPNAHKKYSYGSCVCFGDGEKARRFDELIKDWKGVDCICANSSRFEKLGGIVENSCEIGKEEGKRVLPLGNNNTKNQVLYQGAWRDLEMKDEENKKYIFKEMKPSCNPRYLLKFITTEAEGINLNVIDGGGYDNLESLINQLESLKKVFNRIAGLPLDLRIVMKEKVSKKWGTTKYPFIYIHLPHSVEAMMQSKLERTLGAGTVSAPALLEEGTYEDAEAIIIEDDPDDNPLT